MLIHKGYSYRIYPSKTQTLLFAVFFGCCRFVYNYFLALRKKTYFMEKRSMSQYECMRLVTTLKEKYPWLKDCDSMALQESLKDLDRAYRNFFEKRAGYPRFHKKTFAQSYRTRNQSNGIRIEGNHIILPKIGRVKAKISRLLKGRILNATVKRSASGKYFVSLCCEEELEINDNAGGIVGTIAFELDFDMEDRLHASDFLVSDARRYLFAAVRGCLPNAAALLGHIPQVCSLAPPCLGRRPASPRLRKKSVVHNAPLHQQRRVFCIGARALSAGGAR